MQKGIWHSELLSSIGAKPELLPITVNEAKIDQNLLTGTNTNKQLKSPPLELLRKYL